MFGSNFPRIFSSRRPGERERDTGKDFRWLSPAPRIDRCHYTRDPSPADAGFRTTSFLEGFLWGEPLGERSANTGELLASTSS